VRAKTRPVLAQAEALWKWVYVIYILSLNSPSHKNNILRVTFYERLFLAEKVELIPHYLNTVTSV